VAHLGVGSSISLVAPDGFTVAKWISGSEARVVRGQWISPMHDLDVVIVGDWLELDIGEETELMELARRRAR